MAAPVVVEIEGSVEGVQVRWVSKVGRVAFFRVAALAGDKFDWRAVRLAGVPVRITFEELQERLPFGTEGE